MYLHDFLHTNRLSCINKLSVSLIRCISYLYHYKWNTFGILAVSQNKNGGITFFFKVCCFVFWPFFIKSMISEIFQRNISSSLVDNLLFSLFCSFPCFITLLSLPLCLLFLKHFFNLPLSALGVEGVSQWRLPGMEERLVPPRGHHPSGLRTHDLAERTAQLYLQGRRCVCF